jgi:hypothetical protein
MKMHPSCHSYAIFNHLNLIVCFNLHEYTFNFARVFDRLNISHLYSLLVRSVRDIHFHNILMSSSETALGHLPIYHLHTGQIISCRLSADRTQEMSLNYYYERIKYNVQEPARFLGSTSPRKIMIGVNFAIAVLSLGLGGFSIYLSYLLYESRFLSGWVVWLGLSFVGITLAATCSIGMRGAHVLSLELLLTYFWGICVFIAPLILGTVASFDFYTYIRTWFLHEWAESGFQRIRDRFCASTANSKCAPPILGIDGSVDKWCQVNYNATDCYAIRQSALNDAVNYGQVLTLIQGSVCIVILLLIGLSIYICQTIITAPVITQSMNDVINYLLLLPIAGSIGISVYLWWIKDYAIQYSWIAIFFAALGAAVLICIPFGIISGRLKSRFLLTW